MSRILYQNRCRCNDQNRSQSNDQSNEEFLITKKRKTIKISEGKPLQYPNLDEITSQTFQIKYEKKLSTTAKAILNSFQDKYIYYAIDDILYLLRANKSEQTNLLAILYSPILSLQNNFSVNFFDIWIHEIYIEEISKENKFLARDFQTSEQFHYITIKLFYKMKVPVKKQESLW